MNGQPQARPSSSTEAAPSGVATQPPSAAPETDFPPSLYKELDKIKNVYTDNVRKFQRAKARQTKNEEDLALMATLPAHTRYPPGMKPFNPSSTNVYLDKPWSEAANGGFHWQIAFGSNITRKQALQIAHHEHAMFVKRMDLECAKESVTETAAKAQREHLTTLLNTMVTEATAEDKAAQF
eukprot:7662145-Karenia_brevis.AAC.1